LGANFYVGQTTTLGELGLGESGWANLDWAKPSRPLTIYNYLINNQPKFMFWIKREKLGTILGLEVQNSFF